MTYTQKDILLAEESSEGSKARKNIFKIKPIILN